MATLRIQGLSSEVAFGEAKEGIDRVSKVARWKLAAATEKYWEATVTFSGDVDLRRSVNYLQQFIAKNRDRYDGVVLDTTFDGITVLHSDNPVVDVSIIAVHGLGGHGAATWTYSSKHETILWLRDILPRDLPKSRIMTFGYDAATISRSTANIRDTATSLLNGLQTMRSSTLENARPIVFIAHSLGGIVVKSALQLARSTGQYPGIYEHTCALVFFGTPHHGSGTANWGNMVANIVNVVRNTNTNYLDLLKDRSQKLADLDDDFVPLLRDGHFKILSIYERQKMPVKLHKLSISRSVLIVPKDSALLKSTNETAIPSNADHRGVCKFESQNEETYRSLCYNLFATIPKSTADMAPKSELIAKQAHTYPRMVPQDRYFYGRTAILDAMQEHLRITKNQTEGPRCLALYGEPAVGKTSLVRRFIHRANEMNLYDHTLLMTAESDTKLSLEFVGVGRFLNLTKSNADDPATVRDQVLDYLNSTDERILLVFDNADNLEKVNNLRDFWPYTSRCSILVTSREASVVWRLPTNTEGLQIKTMTVEEGEEFLINRLKVEDDADTRKVSRSVALRFNCWPLALGQVSAFILESKTTLKRFWEIISRKPETANRIYEYKDKESSYEYTLSQVWDSILANIEPHTARLLSVLSLFDPDGVPDALFRGWNPEPSRFGDSEVLDEVEYIAARIPLANYNIMEITDGVATLHRIVQSTRLKLISIDERGVAFRAALLLLTASFPKQVFGDHMHGLWVECEPILPHVLAFDNARISFGWDMSHSDAGLYVDMMCDATWYLWEIGRYEEALARVDNAEKVCVATTGLGTLEAARLFVVRGCVLATLNRYREAGAEFQKGLEIRKQLLPPNHQLLANSYMQVGNFLLSEDRFDEAIAAQKQVISIRQQSSEQTPAMMFISYMNLSRGLLGARQLDEADAVLATAATIEKHLKPLERITYKSTRIYVSGNVALARGLLDSALRQHLEALASRIEAKLPAFTLAASRHKVGDIYAKMNNLPLAKTSLLEAIEILINAPGEGATKSNRIARSEMRLADVCMLSGDAAAAGYYREKAIQRVQNGGAVEREMAQDMDYDKLVPHLDR